MVFIDEKLDQKILELLKNNNIQTKYSFENGSSYLSTATCQRDFSFLMFGRLPLYVNTNLPKPSNGQITYASSIVVAALRGSLIWEGEDIVYLGQ